jgi:site-specific DNA-methyltransferase (adenine-specific)
MNSTGDNTTGTGERLQPRACSQQRMVGLRSSKLDSAPDGESEGVGGVRKFDAAGVTLHLGDCRALLDSIEADACVSDPPYGMRYKPGYYIGRSATQPLKGMGGTTRNRFAETVTGDHEDFDPALLLKYPIAVICGAHHFSNRLPNSRGWIVWDKKPHDYPKNDFGDADLVWTTADKPIAMFRWLWAGALRQNGQNSRHLHPTEKPVELMAMAMDYAGVPLGATVLDPYMGSGTTGIACIRTGRKFIGIEKDTVHFDTAVARIQEELSHADFFVGGGGGFSVEPSSAEKQPNDPKLSDTRLRRGCCVVGLRGAADVTEPRVRCSAWLGVRLDSRET